MMNDCRCPHLTDAKPYDNQGCVVEVGEGQILMLCRFCYQHIKSKVLEDMIAASLKEVQTDMAQAIGEAIRHAKRQ